MSRRSGTCPTQGAARWHRRLVELVAACVALLAVAGCAHRYALVAPVARAGLAGVPMAFGDAAARPVPSGTHIQWTFGDGQSASDPAPRHAFALPGHFTVRETVTDESGQRQSALEVTVERRSPLMAVPPGAASALVLDHFWNRAASYRDLLEAGLSRQRVDDALAQIQVGLGIDITQPEEVREAGFDPDEGMALVTFTEEPDVTYVVVGTWDDTKANNTVREALIREGAQMAPSVGGVSRAEVPGSGPLLYAFDRGYLVLRLPGNSKTPPLALPTFEKAPATGLDSVPAVRALRAQLGGGDVLVYESRSALVPPNLRADQAPIAANIQALLASLSVSDHEISGDIRLAVAPAGMSAVRAIFASGEPVLLPARAPAGANLYVGFSGDVAKLLEALTRAPAGQHGAFERWLGLHGIALSELLGSLDHEVGVAGYFDVKEFYRALSDGETPWPRGDLLAEVQVRDAAKGRSLAQQLLTLDGQRPSQNPSGSGTRLEATVSGHPAGAHIADRSLLLSWGLSHLDDALAGGPDPRLSAQLAANLPPEALGTGRGVAYLQISKMVDALTLHAPVPGVPTDALLRAELLAHVAAAPLMPLRDLTVVALPTDDGIRATLRLRLRVPAHD